MSLQLVTKPHNLWGWYLYKVVRITSGTYKTLMGDGIDPYMIFFPNEQPSLRAVLSTLCFNISY